jgi:hypothetical protein
MGDLDADEWNQYYDTGQGKPEFLDISTFLREEFEENFIEKFGDELFRSQQVSIDDFLENRPEYMSIGKTCIALCIARKENESKLLDFDPVRQGCYQYIFHKMNTDWESFSKNKIAFITFNYDRSLEEYLFIGLQSSYNKHNQECAAVLEQIPIVHVHGSLGPLPWQSPNGLSYDKKFDSMNGRTEINKITVEQTKNNIIVMTDRQIESSKFQEAFNLMNRASHIYFLGFGYHPTNLERLRINEIRHGFDYFHPQNSLFQGSAMKMENAEMNSVINKWHIGLRDKESDALLFLRKYVSFA